VKATDVPVTPGVRALRAAGVEFTPHVFDYVDRGGARHSAAALGVPEHSVVKTLVMEAKGREGAATPLLVLMHGDREVSTRELARQIGAREVGPVSAAKVETLTGYVPGGVSPFGTRKALPVYVEESVLALDAIHINGGKRGFLVRISPADLIRVLAPVAVKVAIERRDRSSASD
jgi:Cys-tRNA(Pro) deacylase